MKQSIIIGKLIISIIILSIGPGGYTQIKDRIFDIIPDPGTFEVGYTVKIVKDENRSFGSNSVRHIPCHVWYPAMSNLTKPMNLKDYASLSDSSNIIGNGSLGFSQWALRMKADTSKIDDLIQMPTLAYHNANFHTGDFPVIFYASSFRSRPIENFALFEYLASQGFIIIAVPSIGATVSGMTMDEDGVKTQFQDLRIAYELATNMEHVDLNRCAVIGFSLGAASAVQLAIEKTSIKAVISIDGALSYSYYLLGEPTSEEAHILSAKYLEILQRSIESQPYNNTFFNLQLQNRSSKIQFQNMNHYDFASLILFLKSIRSTDYKPSERSIELNGLNPASISERFGTYESMCQAVYQFCRESVR